MRLRDRLRRLPSPAPKPAPDGAAPRAGDAQALPARTPGGLAAELDKPERIAQLRALIGDVVVRDRMRNGTGLAPAPGSAQPDGQRAGGGCVRAGQRGGLEPAPQAWPFGAVRETPLGPLHILERWLEPHHCHGRVCVRSALEVDRKVLACLALDPAFERVDPSRMLILDTETTGLAGGTGTVPFLIGLGFFEDGVLKIEQLVLRNFGSEAPLLHHLAERLARAELLVTYNGKAFDWPLLRARFILNRVPVPEAPPHLDLLHCARRVWKPRLPSVRLTEVEAALLGLLREDDIGGAQIPALYLRYVRGADPRTLAPVLSHNEHDVIALAAVLYRLCAHYATLRSDDDPLDHLAYAKLALRANDLERAYAFASAAVDGSAAADLQLQAWRVRAIVARRRGDLQAALRAFEAALSCARCERAASALHLALARLCERELRDFTRAHRHARFTLAVEGPEAQGRRLGRLMRKLERISG